MKFKKMLVLLLAAVLLTNAAPTEPMADMLPEFTDVAQMTDETFFGVWNRGEQAWTGKGKIDYSADNELSETEKCVKNSDYQGAKRELLKYLQNRSIGYTPELTAADYPVDLLIDNIFTNRVNFIDKQLEVPCEYGWIETDVTDMIKTVLNGTASVCIHPRKKTGNVISIASKESENAPYVEAVINGATVRLGILQDCYIRTEDYQNENYGAEQELLLCDSGNPIDSNTMVSMIQIDTSEIKPTDVIVQAKLRLYAKTNAPEPQQMILYQYGAFDETTATFSNQQSSLALVSWQGIEGGTDWIWPGGYYAEFGYHFCRFAFLNTMAKMYYDKADEYYSWNAINMMLDFIQDRDVGFPRALEQAIRDDCFMNAFFALINSESMNPEACCAIMKYFWTSADAMLPSFSIGSNWGVTQTKTLLKYAAVFPEFSDHRQWMKTVRSRMENDIGPLILDDGSYIENSNSYAAVVLSTLKDVMKYAQAAGLEFSPDFTKRVNGLTHYIMDTATPAGVSVEWGDGGASNIRNDIYELGKLFSDSDLLYFGSEGESGTVPEKLSALYPVGRRAFMRSNWNENGTFLFINNYRGNIHGHSDALHIYLYAYGSPLLVDTGKSSYDLTNDEAAIWQTYNTEAHNTVAVNGKSQENTDYGETASMKINDYIDFYEGYTNANEGVRHDRSVLFIKPGFFIVSDLLTPDDESTVNSYSQTWHMPYRAEPSIDADTKSASSNFENQANIKIIPADPELLNVDMPMGWGIAAGNAIEKQQYLAYRVDGAGKVSYDTVLYPQQFGVSDNVSVERLETGYGKTDVSALKIKINRNEAFYMLDRTGNGESKNFAGGSYDGKMAYYEKDSYGGLKKAAVSNGKNLTVDGTCIIKSQSEISDLSVSYEGSDMYISSGDENVTAGVYIPDGVSSIWLNGNKCPYVKIGRYAYVGINGVAPEVELTDDGEGVYAVLPEMKLEKYIYGTAGSRKLYQLEIENGTAVKGNSDYNGIISLPYTDSNTVVVVPDYSVSYDKPVRVVNYFDAGETCCYTAPNGERLKIPETDGSDVQTALKNVPAVKAGNDLYITYQLKDYRFPGESLAERPNVPNKPPVSGSSGGSAGGGDGGKPSVTPPVTEPEKTSPEFTDIKGHWAEREIIALAADKIINGISDSLFMPDKSITRAEFSAMLVRAAGWDIAEYSGAFSDVSGTDWFADIIQTANNYGLLSGYEGFARPDDMINREEMAKMIVLLCEKSGADTETDVRDINFGDANKISRWAYPYVSAAVRLGVIKGNDEGNFLPFDGGTRAEAAVMISRILSIIGGVHNEN